MAAVLKSLTNYLSACALYVSKPSIQSDRTTQKPAICVGKRFRVTYVNVVPNVKNAHLGRNLTT